MLLLFVCLVLVGGAASELSCYVCSIPSYQEGVKQDLTCLYEPQSIPGSLKPCLSHLKACETRRVDHKQSGRIESFTRRCASLNEDNVEDRPNYVIYTRYCTTTGCNIGTGVESEKSDDKRIVSILVKDISSSGCKHIVSNAFLAASFLATVAKFRTL